MSDSSLQVTPGTGAQIDTDQVTTGAGTVQRQRVRAVSVDGDQPTIGATADTAWSGTGAGSVVAVLKAIWARLRGGQATAANSLPVVIASDQLPAAAALGDADANPTTVRVGSTLQAYNGATWDRLRTLATAGYGLGVLQVAGAVSAPADVIYALRDTSLHLLIDSAPDTAIKVRMAMIENATNQPIIVTLQPLLSNFHGPPSYATLAAGTLAVASTAGWVNGADGTQGGISGILGAVSSLNLAADRFRIYVQASVAPTTGNVTASYRGIS